MAVTYRTVALPVSTTRSEPKLEWSFFDRRVIQGVVPCSSTAAAAETSNGREAYVSLRLLDPPFTSYIELYTDDCLYGEPKVVAAHGDLILIYAVVAIKGVSARNFPGNFFLYKASREWPSLRRLPSPGNDWRGRGQFTGVLHKGGDDFVVANLQALVGADREEVAQLFRYSSGRNEWELFRLDMPGDPEHGFYPICWYTDTVFSHGSCIYWADYHQGLLFCDIAAEQPDFHFITFPGIETWIDFEEGRGLPETFRTVAVSKGRIWFVDVDGGRFRSKGSSAHSYSVTTWTLQGLEWVQEHTLELSELWSLAKYRQSPLPRSIPEFPMLDLQEDGVLHFIVRESGDSTEHWIATVDMKNSSLKTQKKYMNEIKEPNLTFDVKNMFWDSALLPATFADALTHLQAINT